MSWSLGEIRSLSIKAARGTGYAWGMAEEAGYAVSWLQKHGAPGVIALANYLQQKENYTGQDLCPIEAGCAISDSQKLPTNLENPVCTPFLLIPFMVPLLGQKTGKLEFGNTVILFTENGVNITSDDDITNPQAFTVSLDITDDTPSMQPVQNRVPDDMQSHVSVLEKLAHKTYAPESEQSRLAGAGAGLNDND